ncbi:MAG TPA: hypothetical protein VFQ35_15400 [Polyangiaceae bacterium]|nr:hypothetical protein [Polyangiaceae bacterium]
MLCAALSGAHRVRVIRGGMACGEALGGEVLLETRDTESVRELVAALRITDGSGGQCQLCLGDPTIELYVGDRRRVILGVHHGTHVRWSEWHDDARLVSARALLTWLEQRGISYPSRYGALDGATLESRARQRWLDAVPRCLRAFAENDLLRELSVAPARFMEALLVAFPDPRDQALALFEWLGNGAGSWSAYPVYESAAERLLLCLPFTALAECLRSELSAAQLEGAARFFTGWQFQNERRADATRLPTMAAKRLLEHALRSHDPEKERLARKAFGLLAYSQS